MIGKTISLSGAPYVVVGIVGPGFHTELDTPPDVWLPFQIDPASVDHAQYFSVIARLKPGVTLAMANSQLPLAADEFRRRFPNMLGPRDGFSVQPYPEALVSEVRSSLFVLAGAVSFVLLIACANVANLLLVRATGRKREIALRAAVGASRGRIIRQLLTESVVLSALGGALGLALGLVGVRALVAMNPGDIPRIGEHGAAIALDWRLVLFTICVSLVTGVLFGLIPALDVSRTDLTVTLNESGGRSGTGFRQNKTRSLLVVSEVALALVLLTGAALLLRTFVALRSVNPGFNAHNVLTMRMSLSGSRFTKTSAVSQLIQNAVQRMEVLPAVASAGASYLLPLEGGFGVPFNIVGRVPAGGSYDGRGWMSVSPHYFDVFKIPVVRGRAFNQRDDAAGAPVAMINQALAREFWPQGDPIGERVLIGKGYGPEFEEPERRIIGISADIRDFGLSRNPTPMVYVPMAQVTDGITALANRALHIVWMARTEVPPYSLGSHHPDGTGTGVRRSRRFACPQHGGRGVRIHRARRFQHDAAYAFRRRGAAAGRHWNLRTDDLFGATADARDRDPTGVGRGGESVRNMVVAEGMRLTLVGMVIGIAAAFGLTRLLQSFLFGVQAWDPTGVRHRSDSIGRGCARRCLVSGPARRRHRSDRGASAELESYKRIGPGCSK